MSPRACVSLTYDDAVPVHRTLVAPSLSARGLRGTFYTPAAAGDLLEQRDAWRAIAADGHELGNHTCFHPCRGRPGATWPSKEYDMRTYTLKRFVDEVAFADRVLRAIDGKTQRSFAATCGNVTVGEGDEEVNVVEAIRPYATCIRTGHTDAPLATAPYLVPAFRGDGQVAATVIAAIDAAIAADTWLVVLFHGVGPTHGLNIAEAEHTAVIDHLAAQVAAGRTRAVPVVDAYPDFAA
jgi:sialate O-acetylesterase